MRRPFRSINGPRASSRIAKVFNLLLPLLVDNVNTFTSPHTTATNFIRYFPLNGLQRRLYIEQRMRAMETLTPHIDELTKLNMYSLLCPSTSHGLHSMPRSHSDSRLTNMIYLTAVCRKLRLPLLHLYIANTTCFSCKQILDPLGDHFFTCKPYQKSTLSNVLRNAVFTVLHALGPMSGTVTERRDVELEPKNLVATAPSKRPADVGLRLQPSKLDRRLPPSTHYLAIDVTITSIPNLLQPNNPSLLCNRPKPLTTLAQVHLQSSRDKFNGRYDKTAPGSSRMAAFNREGLLLCPFTMDHLGGLGPFAHKLLFSTKAPPWPGPPPEFDITKNLAHTHGDTALERSRLAPHGIISRASANWSSARESTYGTTHHDSTPMRWAVNTLSLKIISALSAHILRSSAKSKSENAKTKPTKPNPSFLGSPCPFFLSPTTLCPVAPPNFDTY